MPQTLPPHWDDAARRAAIHATNDKVLACVWAGNKAQAARYLAKLESLTKEAAALRAAMEELGDATRNHV